MSYFGAVGILEARLSLFAGRSRHAFSVRCTVGELIFCNPFTDIVHFHGSPDLCINCQLLPETVQDTLDGTPLPCKSQRCVARLHVGFGSHVILATFAKVDVSQILTTRGAMHNLLPYLSFFDAANDMEYATVADQGHGLLCSELIRPTDYSREEGKEET